MDHLHANLCHLIEYAKKQNERFIKINILSYQQRRSYAQNKEHAANGKGSERCYGLTPDSDYLN